MADLARAQQHYDAGHWHDALRGLGGKTKKGLNGEELLLRGLCLLKVREFERGQRDLEGALQAGIDDAWRAHFQLFALHKAYRDRGKMLRSAIATLKSNPDFATTISMGIFYLREGKFAKAESIFQQAEEMNPTDFNGAYNLACCYGLQGRDDEAIDALRRASALAPSKVASLFRSDDDLSSVRQHAGAAELLEASGAPPAPAKEASPVEESAGTLSIPAAEPAHFGSPDDRLRKVVQRLPNYSAVDDLRAAYLDAQPAVIWYLATELSKDIALDAVDEDRYGATTVCFDILSRLGPDAHPYAARYIAPFVEHPELHRDALYALANLPGEGPALAIDVIARNVNGLGDEEAGYLAKSLHPEDSYDIRMAALERAGNANVARFLHALGVSDSEIAAAAEGGVAADPNARAPASWRRCALSRDVTDELDRLGARYEPLLNPQPMKEGGVPVPEPMRAWAQDIIFPDRNFRPVGHYLFDDARDLRIGGWGHMGRGAISCAGELPKLSYIGDVQHGQYLILMFLEPDDPADPDIVIHCPEDNDDEIHRGWRLSDFLQTLEPA